MKINSSYIVAILAGVMLAGFLPHEEWVTGWAGILALIVTVVAGLNPRRRCIVSRSKAVSSLSSRVAEQ